MQTITKKFDLIADEFDRAITDIQRTIYIDRYPCPYEAMKKSLATFFGKYMTVPIKGAPADVKRFVRETFGAVVLIAEINYFAAYTLGTSWNDHVEPEFDSISEQRLRLKTHYSPYLRNWLRERLESYVERMTGFCLEQLSAVESDHTTLALFDEAGTCKFNTRKEYWSDPNLVEMVRGKLAESGWTVVDTKFLPASGDENPLPRYFVVERVRP
jgi:hypothetical protein